MKKFFKVVATVISLCACFGSLAFGGSMKASADLYWTTMEPLVGRTPECALFLEEAKVKNMASYGYYNVDGADVWYFTGDGTETANPEIRFVTEGTQTQTKPYTYDAMTVESFSFYYRIDNATVNKRVVDTNSEYIVQILASDGTYPIIVPQIIEDGGWHMISVDQYTPVYNAANGASTYGQINQTFSGFLFKMAGLDGELMIMDIEVRARGTVVPPLNPYEEPEIPEESEEPDDGELPEVDLTPETSEEPTTSETPEVSETPETSEKPQTSEKPEEPQTSEKPQTSEQPETSEEESLLDTVLAQFGCASAIGGGTTIFALAGAGLMMAIRKRKE